jgi:hypothetical protein
VMVVHTAFSKQDYQLISGYCMLHRLKPELSTFPMVRFSRPDDGEIVTVAIGTIRAEFERGYR